MHDKRFEKFLETIRKRTERSKRGVLKALKSLSNKKEAVETCSGAIE